MKGQNTNRYVCQHCGRSGFYRQWTHACTGSFAQTSAVRTPEARSLASASSNKAARTQPKASR